jgi:formamidopyrimidine-DNA glycosylase
MPEYPDVTAYLEALRTRIVGQPLQAVRLFSPFVLRSVEPPIASASGKKVEGVRRIGKRIVLELESDLFLVIHLMIAGRLHWKELGAKAPGKIGLAALDFPTGTLTFTEASSKKRASLHLVRGERDLAAFDRGGIEVMEEPLERFAAALKEESHTLKRALTDPRLFSGIGNAYSDEILHRAQLSPVKLTRSLDEEEVKRLFDATRATMKEWTDRLVAEAKKSFPEKVTAFRPEMAVHGKYKQPCPVCGSPVQRIVHADNETNYCAKCQTGGKLLADRALSKLLKSDWPKSLEELDDLKKA